MKLYSSLLLCLALAVSVIHAEAGAQETNTPPAKPTVKVPPKTIEPAEAQKLVTEKKVVVLDVRTPDEFAGGHITGAVNLDFRDKDFAEKVAKLDKSKSYLVSCSVGVRSARACDTMSQLEFKSLSNLKGGMTAWEKAGLPVEK